MAKTCAICGKERMAGGHRRHNTTSNISRKGAWGHRAKRTTRSWQLNLRKALIETSDGVKRDWVCMKCYKKARAK